MLAIRLPAEIEKRLDALARATGRTKTYYAREAILAHLDDLEETYLAKQKPAGIRASRVATVSLGDVIKELGNQENDLLL